jgi:hypothetical protein
MGKENMLDKAMSKISATHERPSAVMVMVAAMVTTERRENVMVVDT